ncbi:MAG: ABC transporter ATP-binding protein [Sulfurimonas sp. RIFOXYD12_FULL_33_39]|uniref:ABC transporter ATP-binding protein n=1 Tax=unclassified Sulfurimonas TaxID=2623549 RepID=UPI0008ADB39C|nr:MULTISPECIES: ABC transporter ATP-binding protein [unclassified Sulfurimonas]OHE08943.1 MAG: ABC transporter ATP-binding protein [Sulfurimonas sp. RIFOXYD12_FULL_33_39]OHE14253.1 MAG: ABC transporter ATP-binding protein [Sulfurimonas sp. RIFOXYD2_FULL_34_21]DAB28645.1 MAG TPA: ABC transporter ATP-binding protein [Sulfurimonas sp. UBA10385]
MNNEPITFKSIFKLILDNKKALLYGQVFTFIAILISIPIPLMLPVLVDEVLLHKPSYIVNSINYFFGNTTAFNYIAIVTFAVIFLRFLYFVVSIIVTKIFTKIAKYVTFMIRKRLIEHLKISSMNEYETLGSGAIASNLVTDVNTLDSFIISSASRFVSSVFTLLAVGVVMVMIDPVLGILILVIQPLIMLISKKMSKKVGALKKEENIAIEEFQNSIGETLDLYGQIKASNKESYFFSKAVEQANIMQKTSNEYGYKSVAYERLSYTIFLAAFEILRASGLILVAYSDLSIGMMFAMFSYIWFIMTPVQDILSMQYSYASAKAAIERINRILLLKTESSKEKKIDSSNVDIFINNLDFSYIKNKKVLSGISLDIKHGSKIALIGASGSGKTTLAQVISGFYEKQSGELKYNGIDIEDLDKSSLRERVFLVLQMPILFNSTLRFNITMGNESITDEEIYKALEMAQLLFAVNDMKDGLDTIVGKHGIRLSGGQRQRLSVARMIIANPSIVIFDESTSALDVQTEAKLQTSINSFLTNKTVITIAHRLSTVKHVDMIYVLDDGKIVQRGSHKELEYEEGHYMEFIKNQLI